MFRKGLVMARDRRGTRIPVSPPPQPLIFPHFRLTRPFEVAYTPLTASEGRIDGIELPGKA